MESSASDGFNDMIKLCSNENAVFRISRKALYQSTMLKTMVENLDLTSEKIESSEPIPVPHANTEDLRRVVEWCEHHRDDAPLDMKTVKQTDIVITPWDAQFLNIANDELHKLICVANFLEINKLLRMACRIVAGWLKNKSPEMMRVAFGIPNATDIEEMGQGPKRARR